MQLMVLHILEIIGVSPLLFLGYCPSGESILLMVRARSLKACTLRSYCFQRALLPYIDLSNKTIGLLCSG